MDIDNKIHGAIVGALLMVLTPHSTMAATNDADASPVRVIVELTQAPATAVAAASQGASSAALQRSRVRKLIAAEEAAASGAAQSNASPADAAIRHEYRVVLNGFGATLSARTIATLKQSSDVRRVVDDRPVEGSLDVSVPLIGAPQVWNDLGYRGEGVTIAIIDTGVAYTHQDLGGCYGAGCKVRGGYDFVNRDADPFDDQGHGTHVAATAAGVGMFAGVAPGASILAYKVLDALGRGLMSDVIAGVERAVDPNDDGDASDHVQVISMSLGGPGSEEGPLAAAVDNATRAGVLSVVAAGNAGAYFTVGEPGAARTALTVGATDDEDTIASFSSRGPTPIDRLPKPEITAPGVNICAAIPNSAFPGNECRDGSHAALSGTSMATPHVAGAAALLIGLFPQLDPESVKALLVQSSKPIADDVVTAGSGRVAVRSAVDQGILIAPSPVTLGVDRMIDGAWSGSRSIAIRNLDDSPKQVTLSFAGPLPTGATLSIDPSSLSLAPNGSAAATVNVELDGSTPVSDQPPYLFHSRLVVASGDATAAEALVTFAKEGPVANDRCEDSQAIGELPFAAETLTVAAKTESDDPQTACDCDGAAHSVWYSFTPSENASVRLETTGSGFDTVLSVFTGECGSLTPVACNDDWAGLQSRADVDVSSGTTYYVRVASYCGSNGGFLHLSAKLATDDPAVTKPLAGRRLRIRDHVLHPARRMLQVRLEPGTNMPLPGLGTIGDPTIEGASLVIFNDLFSDFDIQYLPAAGWKGLGSPAGSGGFRYQDPKNKRGACSRVVASPTRGIVASCAGSGVLYSLNEQSQGGVWTMLELGPMLSGRRYCGYFGGQILRDYPASGRQPGFFNAVGAPKPAFCPF